MSQIRQLRGAHRPLAREQSFSEDCKEVGWSSLTFDSLPVNYQSPILTINSVELSENISHASCMLLVATDFKAASVLLANHGDQALRVAEVRARIVDNPIAAHAWADVASAIRTLMHEGAEAV